MCKLQCFVLCFLTYCAFGSTGPASFINPCKPDDAPCIKANALAATPYFIKGIPELDLPPADPIILKDIRSDDKGLKLGFRNMKVTGISKCELVDITRDLEQSTITLVEDCPLTATGQYDLDGKLLIIHAEGNGDFVMKTEKTRITVTIKVGVTEKGGAKYWKITGFDYSYDILDKPSIKFENLFGGDEKRAKPIQDVIDNSATELIREFGGPIIKELITSEVNIVNKFFKAIPISELELA